MHFASHRNFVKPASIGKVTIVKPASIGKATFSIGLFNLMAGNSLSGDRSEAIAATKSIQHIFMWKLRIPQPDRRCFFLKARTFQL
jgi:hypothetical protein